MISECAPAVLELCVCSTHALPGRKDSKRSVRSQGQHTLASTSVCAQLPPMPTTTITLPPPPHTRAHTPLLHTRALHTHTRAHAHTHTHTLQVLITNRSRDRADALATAMGGGTSVVDWANPARKVGPRSRALSPTCAFMIQYKSSKSCG
jgi:hypothetical protein